MGSASGMMSTVQDPQKLISGFVGGQAAGVKPPAGKAPDLKRPAGSALTPATDLQQRYTIDPAGSGGGAMDEQTMRLLAMLASR